MIYISKFRSNDLNPSKGKQIEFNKGVVDKFFNFTDSEHTVDFECHSILNTNLKENIHVEFKLSPSRGDYKIYQNNDGSKDLKDFFLETLHLESDKNLDDYFAIKKKTSTQYILYYLPKDIVFSNFFSIASSDQILFIPEKSEELKEELETLIPYQSIYYGAPGTGKSYSVKCETEAWEKKGRVVRTTFHPDSDYSTFVGAYKPTTKSVQRYDIYNKPMTRDGVPVMEQVITYEFVEQAFLQAYIDAWRNREEPEFLIIEEINRGNCAQIFGDLFQLLDRGNDGYSEYAIRADKDLQKHLSKAFEDVEIEDYPNVKTGDVTEGYNIIPNFFISAKIDTAFDYSNDGIEKTDRKKNKHKQEHFKNRLFDRDTLLLFHYDVNFLFVLSLYARNSISQKTQWKQGIRDKFRKEIQDWLQKDYDFYAMQAHPGVDAKKYIKEHFQEVLGKIYTPFKDDTVFSLALESANPESDLIRTELKKFFYIKKCKLGSDPALAINAAKAEGYVPIPKEPSKDGVLMVMMEDYDSKSGKFADGRIAIGLKMTDESMRILENIQSIGFILFHTRKDDGQHMFALTSPCEVHPQSSLDDSIYKNINTANLYLQVSFDSSAELDSSFIHSSKAHWTKQTRYDAQYEIINRLLSEP